MLVTQGEGPVGELLAVAVELPEPGQVGDPVERAVPAPLGLPDRVLGPPGQQLVVDVQLGAVPRHVGVVPAEIRKAPPVRAEARERVEVAPAREHLDLAPVERNGNDLVDHLALAMSLSYADDA